MGMGCLSCPYSCNETHSLLNHLQLVSVTFDQDIEALTSGPGLGATFQASFTWLSLISVASTGTSTAQMPAAGLA